MKISSSALPNAVSPVSAVPTFQWSTSEQIYTPEKAADGSTLYAISKSTTIVQADGQIYLGHGISNFKEVHRVWATFNTSDGGNYICPFVHATNSSLHFTVGMNVSNFTAFWIHNAWSGGYSLNGRTLKFFGIYTKN